MEKKMINMAILRGAGLTTVALLAGVTAASPAAAVSSSAQTSATVDECTNGRNGFVSIPHNQRGTPQRYLHRGANNQALVSLELATIQGQQRAFAKSQPRNNGSGYSQVGDQV